jgi:autotransporter-associated beta strand protein
MGLNEWVVPSNSGTGTAGYTAYTTSATPSAWAAANNVALSASTAANVDTTAINSLKLVGPSTVTINPSQSLTLSTGGLLVPGNAAGSSTITGGTLLGGASADLIVHQNHAVNTLTIASVIADNGGMSALTKSGQGTLVLSGNNTYTGPTYINGTTISANAMTPNTIPAGTLQIGNGGTSGSIDSTSSITNRGTFVFNRSDAITFAAPISGNGALKVQAGNVTLTGNNSYTGATTISAGTLQIGNGGTIGSLGTTASVTDNGTLAFNRSDDVTLASPVSGLGSLVQQGAGRLILSATNSYQGSTSISAGTLALAATGSISNSTTITIAAGASFDVSAVSVYALVGGVVNQVLSGSGSVRGGLSTAPGTRISPAGNGAAGTLAFVNDLTLAGGILNMDVSAGGSDLITVGGALNLAGGTIHLGLTGALPNGTYKLIQYAGSLNGSVANLTVSGFSQAGQVATLSSATAGQIDLVVSSFVAPYLVWQGDGANNFWDTGVTLDWTNSAGTLVAFAQNNEAIFDDTSANTLVNLQGVLSPGIVTVKSEVNNYTFQGAGQIGSGSLVKNGASMLTILTTNTFTGPTIVNSGTLQLGDGALGGSIASAVISNFAAITFNSPGEETIAGAIGGSGTLTQAGVGLLSLTASNTFAGPTVINSGALQVGVGGSSGSLGSGPVTDNAVLVFNRSGSVLQSGAISGSGSVSNIGAGVLTLGAANSYSGNTVIANGTVKLGTSDVIPDGAGTGNVVLNGSAAAAGALDLNGFNETINGLAGASGAVLSQVVNNGGTAGILTVGNGDASTTFQGQISDGTAAITLVKTGTGTLTLQPGGLGNRYSGGTIVSNGVVSGGSSTTANGLMCGSGAVTLVDNSGLQLGGYTGSSTPDYGVFVNAVIVATNATATVYGTCRGGGFAPSSVTGPANSILTFVTRYVRGNLGGDWTGFKGQLIVSNTATSGNDLRLNTAIGFPNAKVHLAANAYAYNLVTGTPTISVGELTGDTAATIALGGSQAALWSVGGLNTSAQYDGSILDSHGIIKVGTGTWTLTSANLTYTGPTSVSNGVLALSGSAALPGSATITLSSPGVLNASAITGISLGTNVAQKLQGNGTLQGNLTMGALGTLAPGWSNSIATLTVTGSATLGGTNYMKLNRTNAVNNSDRLQAASVAVSGGALIVTNVGPAFIVGDTFTLFSAPVSGSFAATSMPAEDSVNQYTWTDRLAIDGTVVVASVTPIVNPTPASLVYSVSGTNLTFSWPQDHIGWRLITQTNNLAQGISTNTNDWATVAGSFATNQIVLPLESTNSAAFYRIVYP